MNDVEREVREFLLDEASQAPLVERMPDGVRPKVRRRQTAKAVVAALATLTVLTGVAIAMRSHQPERRNQPVQPPDGQLTGTRPVFQRTTSIGGFAVTSPSDWYVVDYWGGYHPDGPNPLLHTSVPIFEVTNFDPGLSKPVCDVGPGESPRLPPDGIAMLVTAGDGVTDLCGGSVAASDTGRGAYPYRRVIAVGADVTEEQRAIAEQIWGSVQAGGYEYYYSRQGPAYVLDGWNDGNQDWLLEAHPSNTGIEVYPIAPRGGFGDSATLESGRAAPIQGETVGFVTEDAARVEYHRSGVPTPLVARLLDLPSSLASDVDAYVFVEQPEGGPSEVLAYGAEGTVLGSNVPPLTDTQKVGTVDAFGATWIVKISTAGDGYWPSTCVEPAGEASPLSACERGWGGGALVQTFDGPDPAVFVTQGVGDLVGAIDVQSDDGRVFHAVMVPTRKGGNVAVVALEGSGSGRFVYSLTDGRTDEGRRPEAQVEWQDVGQGTAGGSFAPPGRA